MKTLTCNFRATEEFLSSSPVNPMLAACANMLILSSEDAAASPQLRHASTAVDRFAAAGR
jgi:hypothetical protein